MQSELRHAFDTVMEELAERGVHVGQEAREGLLRQFGEADDRYAVTPDRELLQKNTAKLIRLLTGATESDRGGEWTSEGDSDSGAYGERPAGEMVSALTSGGVARAFTEDCLWPWCSKGGDDDGLR